MKFSNKRNSSIDTIPNTENLMTSFSCLVMLELYVNPTTQHNCR